MIFKSMGLVTPPSNRGLVFDSRAASLERHNDGKDGVVNALSATCTC